MADAPDRHDTHDPALVASLFDGDLGGSELTTAQLWVASCTSCASLYADLLALSQATRAQPTPPRTRDFRLTAEDAARLRADAAEPLAADARLTGVMTDRRRATAHTTHDTTLVASLADHSLSTTERAAGEELVATCAECATLRDDLVALVSATRAMPTPPRPIDYTLTRGHAARLRPNPWRRLVAVIGSAHDGVTRPLAVGLTALGIVGILVASAPAIVPMSMGLGGSAAATQGISETQSITNAAPPPAAAAPAPGSGDTAGGGVAGAEPARASDRLTATAATSAPQGPTESAAPAFGAIPPKAVPSGAPVAGAPQPDVAAGQTETRADASAVDEARAGTPFRLDPLLIVSAALLVVGLGLFLLRWTARRLGDA